VKTSGRIENKQLNLKQDGFCFFLLFFFSNFIFGSLGFYLKKLKIMQYDFELAL